MTGKSVSEWIEQGEIDLDGLWGHLAAGSPNTSIVKGAHYANSMKVSGLVERIVLMRSGAIRLEIRTGTGAGATLEQIRSSPIRYVIIMANGISAQVSE